MASDTITGSRYGSTSNGPYLQLHWNEIEQDIAGNRTKVRLTLRFRSDAPRGISYIFYSRTGYLQGQSYTYSGSASGSNVNLVLRQQDVWITHDSNGTKKVTFSGDIRNLGLTFSGNSVGTMTVSGSVNLTAIPRGSTLSAFSFASSLQIGTKNTINYTVKRHSGNYRHQFQLRDGSVTIATWDNVSSNGSDTLSLTGAQVNTILGRMSTVTSKSFTLRVATRSGVNGGWIGSAVTRNASVSVNSNVTPQVISTSATPIGNSWAVGKGFYVQGQTGVQAEFSSSARGGAGVKSRSISIGSLSSGGSVVGDVFRHSQSRVNSTGNIKITYKITDTRGRSVSAERTINFRAYTPPQITSFTVGRSSPTSSTVNIKSQGSIHGMGGQNTGTMTVTQQGVTGNVRSQSLNNTTPSFNDSFNRTVVTSASADFTITVTDSLGNRATSTSTVGTAFMEFSIRKGKGVGIGKVHEQGVLDVDGDIYLNGEKLDTSSSVAWGNVTGKPSTFTPSSHNHSGNNITSGTVPYARLPVGTGSSQVAKGNHTHNYLPTSGGTVKGNLLVTGQGRMGNGKLNVENKGSYNIHIDNSAGQYGEVTMRPSAHNHGNVGSLKYAFDSSAIKTMTNGSNRETKADIKPYDESVAYEELRDIPIYTFKYKEGQYENYHLGSMMEYMPLDIIDTGATADADKANAWTHDNAIWFNMAVSKELQKRLENLEEKNRELEIRLNELEEKL